MGAMMRGDLALRQISLGHLGRPGRFPGILVAREMRGKLSFVVRLSQTEELLFGLFEDERHDTVADIRLRFALRPTPDPVIAPLDRPGMAFLPPPFLENPGDPAQLRVRLRRGHALAVRFRDGDTPLLQDDSGAVFDGAQTWPTALLVDLLDTLASWLRTRQAGAPQPFVIPAGTGLGRLLQETVAGFRLILDRFDGEPRDERLAALEEALTTVHPALGGGYHVPVLLARLLVQLDAHGDLVTDLDDPDWQQFDIEVRLVPNVGRPVLHFMMHPPDFLTDGDYHSSFLAALRAPEVAAPLRDELDRPDVDEAAFTDFLHDPEQERASLFVRIRRDDLDLVLLRGGLQGVAARLLYQMRFEVTPYPEVRVQRVADIRLLAAEVGAQTRDGRASRQPAQRYFERFFRALRVWQTGMIRNTHSDGMV